ncbi:hypothetical protein ECO10021_18862 [Escherichia coli O26:H11 str. CVM10021]|nr:hypothetical protein FORC28_1142 [Escherichia coli]EJE82166.1 hypothetical protein ECO10021_18862 [Escherichia coli O26:H11 str. CVM10021]
MSRLPDRFIPAGAGNTVVRASGRFYVAVYPRWRGEHERNITAFCGLGGLSPLARGTPKYYELRQAMDRFIPAGAGNTSGRVSEPVGFPVYPRWRGEHTKHT